MSFEIGKTVNGIGDRVLKAPIIRAISDNPVYSAMFLAVIIMVIIMLLYTEDKTTTVLKVGLWSFIAATFVFFLRDRSEIQELEKKEEAVTAAALLQPPLMTEMVPVVPLNATNPQ